MLPEWFHQGGVAMYPLLLCSIVGVAIILERTWVLRRSRIIAPSLERLIDNLANSTDDGTEQLRRLSAEDKTVLGELIRAVFAHASLSKQDNVEAVQAIARQIVGRLERGLTTLFIIAEVSPLLGLLGTCSGMVKLFIDVAEHGLGEPAQISRGIFEALIATVTGLAVAIPALVAYMYIRRRIELLVLEMERYTNELLGRLYH
ncbi:MAG: MotA/TolQ/ExbB proton channel family protein [Verrucomicrobiae bacterium]|nr:MotA/TolQ/ExbB proton channel family protein [Verrucomicrobiae bacterium]